MPTSILLALLPGLLAGAAPAAPGAEGTPDETALVADGEPVGRDEYRDWLIRARGEALVRPFFALDHLVRREAERFGIAVPTEEARERALAEMRVRIDMVHRGDEEAYAAELEASGRSLAGRLAERVQELERELLQDAIASRGYEPSEERLRREWERRHGPGGRLLDARVIRIRPRIRPRPGAGPAEMREERARAREEARERILALRERIEEGADFAELARAHSGDESAARGGLVHGLDRTGWSEDAIREISSLEPGETSGVHEARGALWLVQKVGVRETSFEDVREELAAELRAEGPSEGEVAELGASLLEAAKVEVLPAFHLPPEAGASSRPDDEPILRIDGRDVAREELGRWLLRHHGEVAAERFVQERTILAMGRETGVRPTPEELDARIEEDLELEIAHLYDGDREKWLVDVQRAGRTLDEYRRDRRHRVRVSLALEELARRSRVVTDADVTALWRDRYGEDGRRFDVRWIRVDAAPPELDPDDPAGDEERREEALRRAEARARDLVRRVRQGEDFGALAQRESDDARTAQHGGAPPEGFRISTLPLDMQEAVRALEPGEVGEPIRFQSSFYVFELRGVRHVPFEDVADELRRELEERRPNEVELAAFRNQLVRDVEVRVHPAAFE